MPQTPSSTTDITARRTGQGVMVERRYTEPGVHPFDQVEWEIRDAVIGDPDAPAFEQREVEFPAALYYLGVEGPSVVQDDLYRRPAPSDYVVVRQHDAVFAPDHTRPGSATHSAHLHHALVGALDHLRARR